MLIGYLLSGHDNRSEMIDEEVEKLQRCKLCGIRLDFDYIRKDFKMVRRRVDVSYTYDGYCIVSRRFKEFCEEQGYQHAKFISLPAEPEFYVLKATQIVELDCDKTGVKFISHCDKCQRWKEIIGHLPFYLKNIPLPLLDDLYAMNIPLGSRDAKSADVVIGLESYDKMKTQRFRGICFTEVFTE